MTLADPATPIEQVKPCSSMADGAASSPIELIEHLDRHREADRAEMSDDFSHAMDSENWEDHENSQMAFAERTASATACLPMLCVGRPPSRRRSGCSGTAQHWTASLYCLADPGNGTRGNWVSCDGHSHGYS